MAGVGETDEVNMRRTISYKLCSRYLHACVSVCGSNKFESKIHPFSDSEATRASTLYGLHNFTSDDACVCYPMAFPLCVAFWLQLTIAYLLL